MNWKQLTGLIQLRYRLTRNQIAKGGSINEALITVAFIFLIFFAVSSFIGTALGGAFLLRELSPSQIILIWNIATLVFIGSSIFEFANRVQQNDAVEIDRLLHLPMTFGSAFLLNYVSSLFSVNMLMLAPTIAGLSLAMPIAKGWPAVVAIPLSLSFLFVVTALMYQLRGWFAELAKNKRIKGWIMIVIPLALIGLITTMAEIAESSTIRMFVNEIPIGFLSSGVDDANRNGNLLPGIIGSLCMVAIGSASLYLAYRKAMKKYTGADVTTRNSDKQASANWEQSRQFNKLPWTSKQETAVAIAGLTSLRRAPEMLAALLPIGAAILLGAPYLIGMEGFPVSPFIQDRLPLVVVFLTLIGFPAFLFSTFSYDRDGFRAYVLSPLPRETILHGKNLAIGIPTIIGGWVILLILQIFLPVNLMWFLGAVIQVPASFLLLCLFGHVVSIFAPIGFKRGSMQPVNLKIIPAVAIYVGVFAGPGLAIFPAMFISELLNIAGMYFDGSFAWLYVLLSIVQLVVSWFIYRLALPTIATWLWDREPEILMTVANIPE